jgi:hypothetical protein
VHLPPGSCVLLQLLSGHTNSKERDLLVQRCAAELQVG